MADYIQGRVLDIDIKENVLDGAGFPSRKKHQILTLELVDGSVIERRIQSDKDDDSIEIGNVLRAVDTKADHNHPKPLYRIPHIFNVFNRGIVDIDSKVRTHFEAGTVLSGVVTENTGFRDNLDWGFYFSKVQLDDGAEIEVTLPEGQIPEGTRIKGVVGNSVYNRDKQLMSAGFGNLGGMTLLCKVEQTSKPQPQKPSLSFRRHLQF